METRNNRAAFTTKQCKKCQITKENKLFYPHHRTCIECFNFEKRQKIQCECGMYFAKSHKIDI